MLTRTRALIACAATAVAADLAAATPALATIPTLTAATPRAVYHGKTVGPTPRLPTGTYLVTGIVGGIIASHGQIVCAASPGGNDRVYVAAGQRIQLSYNSFNFGTCGAEGADGIGGVPVNVPPGGTLNFIVCPSNAEVPQCLKQ